MFIIKILLHHLGHSATFENELHLLQHYEPNKNVSNCKIFGQVEPVEKFFSLYNFCFPQFCKVALKSINNQIFLKRTYKLFQQKTFNLMGENK